MTNYKVLLMCFNALPPSKRARLRWHAANKTPILRSEVEFVLNGVG